MVNGKTKPQENVLHVMANVLLAMVVLPLIVSHVKLINSLILINVLLFAQKAIMVMLYPEFAEIVTSHVLLVQVELLINVLVVVLVDS